MIWKLIWSFRDGEDGYSTECDPSKYPSNDVWLGDIIRVLVSEGVYVPIMPHYYVSKDLRHSATFSLDGHDVTRRDETLLKILFDQMTTFARQKGVNLDDFREKPIRIPEQRFAAFGYVSVLADDFFPIDVKMAFRRDTLLIDDFGERYRIVINWYDIDCGDEAYKTKSTLYCLRGENWLELHSRLPEPSGGDFDEKSSFDKEVDYMKQIVFRLVDKKRSTAER